MSAERRLAALPIAPRTAHTAAVGERHLAALPVAPRVVGTPAVDRIYHPYIVAQRMSNDLVIYSRDIGRIVTIA